MVLGPSCFSKNVVPLCSVVPIFCIFCSILWCTREKEKERGTLRRACVALPLVRRNSSDPMASASARANELAKQLPASAISLAVPPPAASTTAEMVDLSAGAAIRGLLLLLLRCVQASSQAERRGYMHQVSGLSYLPLVYLLLPFCFLVICRRYFVCTYSYIWVYILRTRCCCCLIAVPCIYTSKYECVCGCFVLSNKLNGWEHEYNHTTASPDAGFA